MNYFYIFIKIGLFHFKTGMLKDPVKYTVYANYDCILTEFYINMLNLMLLGNHIVWLISYIIYTLFFVVLINKCNF